MLEYTLLVEIKAPLSQIKTKAEFHIVHNLGSFQLLKLQVSFLSSPLHCTIYLTIKIFKDLTLEIYLYKTPLGTTGYI